MDIVFYIIIFIVGTLLGSFYATLIRRMSKEKRAFSIHSYCTGCGEKIKLFEKIPIFSYIFLKGKCRHCKKKIAPIYIIIEILTGVIFLAAAFALRLSVVDFNINSLISFIFIILYFSYIILSIGLDIETRKTSPSLLAYGVIISIIYIVYLWMTKSTTIYISTIYLVIIILLLLLNIVNTKKRAQSSYLIDLLTMLLIMTIFTEELICILTVSSTLAAIALYIMINRIKRIKKKGQKTKIKFSSNARIVFIMGMLNMLILLTLINVNR